LFTSTFVFAAQPRDGFGVGGAIGLPFHIGAAAEYNFGPASANALIGYTAYGWNYFTIRLGGDYHLPYSFKNSDLGMELFLSVGGHLGINITSGSSLVTLGLPVTWSWFVEDIPLKVFAKAGPEFYFSGGIGFTGTAGAYYLL